MPTDQKTCPREELSQLIENYIASLDFPARPAELYAPIRYSLEGGGKRIRPLVALLACRAYGGDVPSALPLAGAVEVFHNFTLLHDDIMDNAPLRRGKPSVHERWGENTAILSGDVMTIYAYHLLAQSPAEHIGALLTEFNAMATEVCEGQQFDMDFETRTEVCEDEYMEMISLKTAALIARAARMGAMAAGAPATGCDALYSFGRELGLAFQLRDDLLDSYSDDPSFGKQVGGDIVEGKKSFLTVTALALADAASRAELQRLLADRESAPADRVAGVRAIYDRLGVRRLTEERIARHTTLAVEALDAAGLPAEAAAPLRDTALSLVGRKK